MSELRIDEDGLDALVGGIHALATRSFVLGPVGFKIRDRIIESEQRLFRASPWPGKKASTTRRYRYPMDHFAADFEPGLEFTPGVGATKPLVASGVMRMTLTTRQAPGQLDQTKQVPGGLDVVFGVKARGPVAYALFQKGGHGGRLKRDPFNFDPIAHGDATGDVVEHIIGQFGRGS